MKENVVLLGEVATIIAGQSPPGDTYNEDGSGLPFFQGKADFGELHPVARKWCVAPKKVAQEGDILISVRAPVGPTNIAKERCCIGRGLAAIRPDETVILRDFVYWNIKYHQHDFITKGQGSTFSAIGQRDLKSFQIALPPLDEQYRIAGILNRVARIERLRKEAQDKMREFIPALFVKMFGDPAMNPMGWEIRHLGEVCTLIGGGTPHRTNSAYFGGLIPWATPTDVTALSSLYIRATRETITETALRESSARLVPAQTVLLTSRATIGYTAIAAMPMATNQGFANLTCNDRLLPEYLANWLLLRRDYLIQLAGGTTFKEISKSVLKKILIPVPPINTQRRFADIVETAQSTVKRMELGGRAAASLGASLMSRLLDDAA